MDSPTSMSIPRQHISRPESVKDYRPRTPIRLERQPREFIANGNQRQRGVEYLTPDMFNSSEITQEEHANDDNEPISTWRPEHTDVENEPKSTWSLATTCHVSSPTKENSSGSGGHHPSTNVSQTGDMGAPPEHIHDDSEPKSEFNWGPENPSPDISATRENSSRSGGHHPSTNVSQTGDLGAPREHIHDGMKPKSKFSRVKIKMVGFWKFMATSPVRLFSRIKRSAL